MNISQLMDKAKAETGSINDADLERKTGLRAGRYAAWRRGHAFPGDELMLKLCTAAKVDPVPWLIWLNAQRTEGPARVVYEDHLQQLINNKASDDAEVIAA